jgi:ribose 5-phosphate isomerase B
MALGGPPPVTARDPNIEADVRAIVRRIVDGLVEDASGTASEPKNGSLGNVSGQRGESQAAEGRDIKAIAIGGDHGGFALKEKLAFKLKEQGYQVVDCGTNSTDAVDYPDIAVAVASSVATASTQVGVVIDGAGIGSAMAANKIRGVRAALCYDLSTARNAREHNHANVLTLGAGLIGDALAWQITQEFLATPYGEGRHAKRVAKIDDLDRASVEG